MHELRVVLEATHESAGCPQAARKWRSRKFAGISYKCRHFPSFSNAEHSGIKKPQLYKPTLTVMKFQKRRKNQKNTQTTKETRPKLEDSTKLRLFISLRAKMHELSVCSEQPGTSNPTEPFRFQHFWLISVWESGKSSMANERNLSVEKQSEWHVIQH